MVEQIRKTLVSSYAGAIIVGWTLAQGISSGIGVLLSPLMNFAVVRYANRQTSNSAFPSFITPPEQKIFDPLTLTVGTVKTVVVLGIGLLLLKWLYIPAQPVLEEQVEEFSE